MFDDSCPSVSQRKWKTVAENYGANYLINEASVDELLTNFHAKRSADVMPGEVEFLKTLILGRYVEYSVKSMNRLTASLNQASRSSTMIGWGLIAVGITTLITGILVSYFK